MISTTNAAAEKPEDKREKLKRLKEFHQPTFVELGVLDASYIPKVFYRPYGKTELYTAFFESEINKGSDVYTEDATADLIPKTVDRILYKWKFNPHYEAEYEKTEPAGSNGHCRYLIPVEELKIMAIAPKVIEQKEKVPEVAQSVLNLVLDDPNEDLPIDQLTICDLAAILLKKPVSHKKWLNEIITKK